MRVFISADIEGIATTAKWDQTSEKGYGYEDARRQMTLEVAAACEGARAAGADYIRVKDSHGPMTNIIPEMLPTYVELTRSKNGSPWGMVAGIEEGFDAAMFVGWHAAAGREGNPMSHTHNTSTIYIKLNGEKMSEFMLYSWACASCGCPSVLLAGDQMLCDDSKDLHPSLITVPVKRGYGGMVTCLHPQVACDNIRKAAEEALRQPLDKALCKVPDHFKLEICYKEQVQATKSSFFPGFSKKDDNTIVMSTDKLWDVLTAIQWVL
ncbi:MAG: M55 family metallopeptidase [Firmicutes bacterium]|nr:M55 family metallopeptidase [Bacillota bacterium]MBQ6260437.1 M55 family metallopeptidase [Bacillota bacterium]MBR0522507.1 M55 family metallopeptidase [Bacillota bacterium]